MKATKNWLTAGVLLAALASSVAETQAAPKEKIKKIVWNQDNAQKYMVTKVYELKHVRAADLAPFVEGAVKRYRTDSKIQRIAYPAGRKEFLIVSTGSEMMPYVDEIIGKLDRPSKKLDSMGSNIEGTGISNYVYYTKHRTSTDMKDIINANILDDNGKAYADVACGMIYWKSSVSKGDQIQKWLGALDRPVPQMSLVMKVYEVRESTLRDLGIDYVAWKNGPGLDLFGAGANLFNSWGVEKIAELVGTKGLDYLTAAQFGMGGVFFAPQFDMSFVRILEQEGLARAETSSAVTLVNGTSASITFSPDFQNIVKSDQDKTTVESSAASTYQLKVNGAVICFKGKNYDKSQSKDGYLYYTENPARTGGSIAFGYDYSVSTPVEANNLGAQLVNVSGMSSSLCFEAGNEQLLGVWEKTFDVKQTVGMPFLSEIPVLKYLFGTEKISKSTTKFFVTLKAEFVNPDEKLAGWAGKMLSENDIIKK